MGFPYKLKRGVDLVNFVSLPHATGLMLAARINVKHLKSSRAAVTELAFPRPKQLIMGISKFDPAGPEGQVCPLRLSCPKRTKIEKGIRGDRAARRPGEAVRRLARLYENPVGLKPWTLEGWLENTKLTSLLEALKEENGGELVEVDLITYRTPMRTGPRPVWTLFITLPGELWSGPTSE